MLIATEGEKVVGTVALIRLNKNLWCGNGEYAYFCFASVLPEYEGQGIYKKLNMERERKAKEFGLNRIIIDTHEKNTHLLKIAKKVGYYYVDYKIREDHNSILMVKWLDGCPYSKLYMKLKYLKMKFNRIRQFGIRKLSKNLVI